MDAKLFRQYMSFGQRRSDLRDCFWRQNGSTIGNSPRAWIMLKMAFLTKPFDIQCIAISGMMMSVDIRPAVRCRPWCLATLLTGRRPL